MHWIYLIHKFHNLIWITEINELFLDILIYWDAPVNAAVLRIRYFFLKHKKIKNTYWPQTFEQLCKLTDYLYIKQYIWMQGLFQKHNNSICKSFTFLIHSGFCSKSIHAVDEPKLNSHSYYTVDMILTHRALQFSLKKLINNVKVYN